MEIVAFWKSFDRKRQTNYLHEEDREWLTNHSSGNTGKARRQYRDSLLSQQRLSLPEYAQSELLDPASRAQLHLGLLPLPYMGDLKNARVVFLLTNPGVSPTDYAVEPGDDFLDLYDKNLRQEFEDCSFPFFYLNPKLCWSSGFGWWASTLMPLIELARMKRKAKTFLDALQYVSARVAVLERAPYHSPNQGALERIGGWSEMPSVKRMMQFSRELCSSGRQMVMYRQLGSWSHEEGCGCAKPLSGRSISLNHRTKSGRTVLKTIEDDFFAD